jgi:hypothetical protein
MYCFFNDCYSQCLRQEDSAEIHGHIEWILEQCRGESLEPRQTDALVWHGAHMLMPRTAQTFLQTEEERARTV